MFNKSRFRNPKFQEKLEQARKFKRSGGAVSKITSRFSLFFLALLAVILFYYLAFSSTFLVRSGGITNGLKEEQISDVLHDLESSRRALVVPKNHILILDQKTLLEAIQEHYPQVKKITSFKKELPNHLSIAVEERTPHYVWQSGGKYYLLDQDGVLFQEIPSYTPETFSQVLITDTLISETSVGLDLGIENILTFVDQATEQWALYVPQTNYVSFRLPGTKSQDIFAKTGIGFSVYFDMSRSPKQQLANLRRILNQEIKPETYTGLSYIDLRLPNIAYYCYRDAPCAPENATTTPSVAN